MKSRLLAASIALVCSLVAARGALKIQLRQEAKPKTNSNGLLLSDVVGIVTVNGQKFAVVFDTGSDILWVPGKNCTSSGPHATECASGKNLFDGSAGSRLGQSATVSFRIDYGTGMAAGKWVRATLGLGDPEAGNQIVMQDVDVGVADRMEYIDRGVFGLSLQEPSGRKPMFIQAYEKQQFDEPIFTAFLKKCNGPCADGGVITLGGFDKENCESIVDYVPVGNFGPLWQFPATGVHVNGQLVKQGYISSIVDTGTSYIEFPHSIIDSVVAKLGAVKTGQFYTVACDAKVDLKLTIAGNEYTINEQQLVLNQGWGSKCVVAVRDAGDEMMILGDPFFRSYCTVFDVKKRQVGFAKPKSQ
ncbi:Peptidase A1 domain-containing protein [Aphelenchoides fujianensis]|nr:Peptidase A1 domain-containing protein [Aphelenchoides fujianensis]